MPRVDFPWDSNLSLLAMCGCKHTASLTLKGTYRTSVIYICLAVFQTQTGHTPLCIHNNSTIWHRSHTGPMLSVQLESYCHWWVNIYIWLEDAWNLFELLSFVSHINTLPNIIWPDKRLCTTNNSCQNEWHQLTPSIYCSYWKLEKHSSVIPHVYFCKVNCLHNRRQG